MRERKKTPGMTLEQKPICQSCRKARAVQFVRVPSGVKRWKCETCLNFRMIDSGRNRL